MAGYAIRGIDPAILDGLVQADVATVHEPQDHEANEEAKRQREAGRGGAAS